MILPMAHRSWDKKMLARQLLTRMPNYKGWTLAWKGWGLAVPDPYLFLNVVHVSKQWDAWDACIQGSDYDHTSDFYDCDGWSCGTRVAAKRSAWSLCFFCCWCRCCSCCLCICKSATPKPFKKTIQTSTKTKEINGQISKRSKHVRRSCLRWERTLPNSRQTRQAFPC